MKCPMCKKGTMELEQDIIAEDGVVFEAYKCQECKETLLTTNQLKTLAEKYRQLRKAKDTIFAKWGNSLAVRIPNEIAAQFGIKQGRKALIKKEKEGIKIIPC